MPRGRKPKPAYLRLLEGNARSKPIPVEVQPSLGTLPDPPDFLNEIAKAEWRRVAQEIYNLRLLTLADWHPFAAYCQHFARWVEAETTLAAMAARDPVTHGLLIKTSTGSFQENPMVGTARRASREMVRYANEFGLTPVARARLAAWPAEAPKSKFDGLIGGRTA